ncbi:uracil-DNA glycosylase [Paraburkholderia acidicola]|uniref:Type-4 uracil-DNA glycosylase n=1 Tax=Paraburkholderia acidicola TaxID=1912599 RepID=A0A2A4F753_9BURK|nr:uracil-DNA glycosylase [Paraburkholderia acidicola]PCE28975.1 uracil-DNA glycosylase [Paraburkholderia acidicola]
MALHESALEELGLATRWVRRGSAPTEAAASAEIGRGDASIGPAASAEAIKQQARHVVDAPVETVEPQTDTPARSVSTGNMRSTDATTDRPDARNARSSTSAASAEAPPPPDDDFAWFDDLPSTPPQHRDQQQPRAREEEPAQSAVATLDWDALSERVSACESCRLCEKRTKTVFGVGDREADWMLVGEAPGENEDRQGEPFVGQAGKLLDNMLRSLDLARDKNVYIANVIKCRPPGNRNPEPDEVARCEPYLQRQVALVKPKLIVALGRFAAQSLLKTDASISSLRGRVHTYEGVPVIVTYHPAYLLRSLHDKAKSWADLCLARDTLGRAADQTEH